MRDARILRLLVLVVVLLSHISICQAYSVSATSTYAEVTDIASPMYNLLGKTWYRYEINMSWDAGPETKKGLSHFDLLQSISCPTVLEDIAENGELGGSEYFQFEPDDPFDLYVEAISGYSTDDSYDAGDNTTWTENVPWFGHVEIGDGVIPEVTGPIAKYQQPASLVAGGNVSDEPGNSGTGTFWFYSSFAPEITQTSETVWEDAVYFKAGNGSGVVGIGDITGYMPYCVPEPTTICLLGLGAFGLLRKKKH